MPCYISLASTAFFDHIIFVSIESMGYDEWAPWSPCTKTCGKGSKTRFRNCLVEVGCGATRDILDCNVFQCPSKYTFSLFD